MPPYNTIVATPFTLPTTIFTNGQVTGNQWNNPTNMFLVDGDVASSNANAGAASDVTVGGYNFLYNGISIPQGAVIVGIEMQVIGYSGAVTIPPITLDISLYDNVNGADDFYPYISGFTGLTPVMSTTTLGTPTYLFATSLSVDQVNNMKMNLQGNGDISLDSFLVRVYFYIPAPATPPVVPTGVCIECDSPIQVQSMSLALPFLVGETKFYLKKGSFAYPNGTPVQPGDVGSCGGKIPFVFDPKKNKADDGNFEENAILDTTLGSWSVLPSGIIEMDLGVITQRALDFKTPGTHVASLMSDHDANSEVIISNNEPYNLSLVRRCQAGTVFSEPIETLQDGVSKVFPTTKFNFKGSVAVQQDGIDSEQANITIANGGGTLPPDVTDTTSDTSGGTPSDTITLTLNSSGLNRGALAQVMIPQAFTVLSALANGVAMTLEVTANNPALRTYQYSIQAQTVGVLTIVITLSGACEWSAGAETFAGVNQTGSFIGATDSASGLSTAPSVTLTTTVDNSLVIDGLITNLVPILYTPGAGQGENWHETANASPIQGGSSTEAAGLQPDNVIMNYSITQNTSWVITAVEVLGITIPSASGQAAIQFEDEGVPLGAPGTVDEVDFTGPSVTATRLGNKVTVAVAAAGSGTALSVNVNQVGHGLLVGNVIQVSGANTFAVAQADTAANSEAVGIVTVVIDANNFTYISSAIQLSGAFVPVGTPGEAVWLDPVVPGGLTMTRPETVGQVRRGMGTIIDSGAKMYFDIAALAEEITADSGGGFSAIDVNQFDDFVAVAQSNDGTDSQGISGNFVIWDGTGNMPATPSASEPNHPGIITLASAGDILYGFYETAVVGAGPTGGGLLNFEDTFDITYKLKFNYTGAGWDILFELDGPTDTVSVEITDAAISYDIGGGMVPTVIPVPLTGVWFDLRFVYAAGVLTIYLDSDVVFTGAVALTGTYGLLNTMGTLSNFTLFSCDYVITNYQTIR